MFEGRMAALGDRTLLNSYRLSVRPEISGLFPRRVKNLLPTAIGQIAQYPKAPTYTDQVYAYRWLVCRDLGLECRAAC
jgi:hypothetical protein